MNATLGDFLTLARRHLSEAARQPTELPAAAHGEIILELNRLLTVLAKYAREGLREPGDESPPPTPSLPELAKSGVGLLICRAAENLAQAASALPDVPAASGKHPVAARVSAAADCLVAGRDLIRTHQTGDPGNRTSQLWPPVMNSAPVRTALTRELAGYSLQIAELTARLSQPDPASDVPASARTALCAATGWLAFSGTFLAAEPTRSGIDPGQIVLHAMDANLPSPRRQPATQATVTEFRAGTIATAHRLRHLALRQTGLPDFPASSAAACWRHNALAAAIIGHTSELTLHALTDRAGSLGCHDQQLDHLRQTSQALRIACQSWQAVTHAWDPVTTGPSRRPSQIAIELDDLVLWTGRLAHAGTWTPARSNATPPRPPADLVPAATDLAGVLIAVSHSIEAVGAVARLDLHQVQAAAAASQIYSPARLQPENRDRVHIYRYRPATTDQIANLLTTYDQAVTATDQATATLDDLLNLDTTGDSHSLARAIGHTRASPQRRQFALPSARHSPATRPEATGLERLLHEFGFADPELLLRATALDHATRALTAEVISKAVDCVNATDESLHSGYPYARKPGPSAQLAGQDTPGLGIAPATAASAPVQRLRPEAGGARTPRHFPAGRRRAT